MWQQAELRATSMNGSTKNNEMAQFFTLSKPTRQWRISPTSSHSLSVRSPAHTPSTMSKAWAHGDILIQTVTSASVLCTLHTNCLHTHSMVCLRFPMMECVQTFSQNPPQNYNRKNANRARLKKNFFTPSGILKSITDHRHMAFWCWNLPYLFIIYMYIYVLIWFISLWWVLASPIPVCLESSWHFDGGSWHWLSPLTALWHWMRQMSLGSEKRVFPLGWA